MQLQIQAAVLGDRDALLHTLRHLQHATDVLHVLDKVTGNSCAGCSGLECMQLDNEYISECLVANTNISTADGQVGKAC